MTPSETLTEARRQGHRVAPLDDRLRVVPPPAAALHAALLAHRSPILALLRSEDVAGRVGAALDSLTALAPWTPEAVGAHAALGRAADAAALGYLAGDATREAFEGALAAWTAALTASRAPSVRHAVPPRHVALDLFEDDARASRGRP